MNWILKQFGGGTIGAIKKLIERSDALRHSIEDIVKIDGNAVPHSLLINKLSADWQAFQESLTTVRRILKL